VLKSKLANYHNNGQAEDFPIYAVHHLLELLTNEEGLRNAPGSAEVRQFLIYSYNSRQETHPSMKLLISGDLSLANNSYPLLAGENPDDSNSFFDDLIQDSEELLQKQPITPWEALIHLGHSSTYKYNLLLSVLNDYKNLNEQDMAIFLLNVSINHSGTEDFDT
jgi:hypothetical protein